MKKPNPVIQNTAGDTDGVPRGVFFHCYEDKNRAHRTHRIHRKIIFVTLRATVCRHERLLLQISFICVK